MYHIRDVIPPDEYQKNCTDSVYTNYGAALALTFAAEAAEVLGLQVSAEYRAIAEALVILFNETRGMHPGESRAVRYEH